jgi:phosphinothricin acetyltransferase
MIRPARPDDAQSIADIWNACIRDTTDTFTTVEKDPETLAAQIELQPYLMAEAAGAVAGFVTYGQFRGGPGYVHTVEHSIHVADGARGQGLGRALMHACQDHARRAGIHSMIAGISAGNTAGVAFHESLGFVTCAHLAQVGWKWGRWHDLILMQKML